MSPAERPDLAGFLGQLGTALAGIREQVTAVQGKPQLQEWLMVDVDRHSLFFGFLGMEPEVIKAAQVSCRRRLAALPLEVENLRRLVDKTLADVQRGQEIGVILGVIRDGYRKIQADLDALTSHAKLLEAAAARVRNQVSMEALVQLAELRLHQEQDRRRFVTAAAALWFAVRHKSLADHLDRVEALRSRLTLTVDNLMREGRLPMMAVDIVKGFAAVIGRLLDRIAGQVEVYVSRCREDLESLAEVEAALASVAGIGLGDVLTGVARMAETVERLVWSLSKRSYHIEGVRATFGVLERLETIATALEREVPRAVAALAVTAGPMQPEAMANEILDSLFSGFFGMLTLMLSWMPIPSAAAMADRRHLLPRVIQVLSTATLVTSAAELERLLEGCARRSHLARLLKGRLERYRQDLTQLIAEMEIVFVKEDGEAVTEPLGKSLADLEQVLAKIAMA
ncbi:MAG: hypothetical protein AB1634_00905 [Thermodesulfobacteriota bacterium]